MVEVVDGPVYDLGEGAVWDEVRGELLTVDMVRGECTSTRFGPAGVEHDRRVVGDFVGAVLPGRDGAAVVVTMRGLATVGDDGTEPLVEIVDSAELRLNDAACDARGRVWVGSTALDGSSGRGALHVWDGREVRTAVSGLTLPNGVGWSPDGATLYFSDSGQSRVFRADFDESSGAVGEVTVLSTVQGGVPDGLCVGDDGSVWVAIWDGGRIERIDPDGSLREVIQVPVTRPTSCALVPGTGLVVTTARFGLDEEELARQPLAGRLLRCDVDASGVPSGRVVSR